MCLNLHDHQASRYSYGSTDLNIMVTTNQKHATGSHTHIKQNSSILLLLLHRFSCVRLYATQWTAAHQAPTSLGFSRQEHWSGLPFPSPVHESEKWKWNRSVISDSSRPHGLQPTRLLHPWDFPGKSTVQFFATFWAVAHKDPPSRRFFRQEILEWVAISSSRGSSWPRNRTRVFYVFCTAGRCFTYWAIGEVYWIQPLLGPKHLGHNS